MSQVGFYYWHGRPLQLLVDKEGQYYIKGLPKWLRERFDADVKAGKIKLH